MIRCSWSLVLWWVALGDGVGDGFVGAPGGGWEVDGGAFGEWGDGLDFADGVGAEAAGGRAGFAFFPSAKEVFAGAGVGAEAVGVDDAFGAVVVDAQGRPGADVRGERGGNGMRGSGRELSCLGRKNSRFYAVSAFNCLGSKSVSSQECLASIRIAADCTGICPAFGGFLLTSRGRVVGPSETDCSQCERLNEEYGKTCHSFDGDRTVVRICSIGQGRLENREMEQCFVNGCVRVLIFREPCVNIWVVDDQARQRIKHRLAFLFLERDVGARIHA